MAAGAQTISAPGAEVAVSVVIPCHNASEFLADALRSVQNQTLRGLECLVIDDASTDDSVAIAKEFVDADPRFKLLSLKKNEGASAARNAGLAQARGEWIALLDADDLYVPARLETLARIGEEEQAELVIDEQIVTEFPSVRSAHRAFGFRHAKVTFTEEDFYRGTRLFRRSLSMGYMKPLMRREFVRRSNVAYDTSVLSGEDFLFYAHLLVTRPHAVATSFAGYVYRRRRGSLSRADTHMHVHAQLGDRVLSEFGTQLSSTSRSALAGRRRDLEQLTMALPALGALRGRKWMRLAWEVIKQPSVALTCLRLLKARALRWTASKTSTVTAGADYPP